MNDIFQIPDDADPEVKELLEDFFSVHGDVLRELIESIRRIVAQHDGSSYLLMRENLFRIVHMMNESLASQVDEKLN